MLKFIKSLLRGIFVTLSLLLLLCIVYAQDVTTVFSYGNDINVILNGVQVDVKDVNSSISQPFIVYGTMYVPIKYISDNFRKTVRWNNNTNSVIITDILVAGDSFLFDFEGKQSELPRGVKNILPIQVSDNGRLRLMPQKAGTIYDRTTDEIWEKMGMNVFGHQGGGFIYKNGTIIHLPGQFYYGRLGTVCVADLNNDGDYQLLYISTWGSGVNGHSLNCYSEKYKITSNISGYAPIIITTDDRNFYIGGRKLKLEKSEEGYVLTVSTADKEE